MLDDVEEKNLSIKDLEISNIIPNVINGVIIGTRTATSNAEIYLPKDMTGERYKKWVQGKGGIFFKDVKRFMNNQPCGKYVLLEGNNQRIIARLIEDIEFDVFNTYKLIDGKIKDKPYMILRSLKEDDELTTTRYIHEVEEPAIHEIIIETQPESEENEIISISLFED